MDPELKAYLDEWSARRWREFDAILDALCRPATELRAADPDNFTAAVDTSGDDGPVQASSGTTEFVTTAVWLYEPPATTPIIEESLVVAPAVPIDTTSGAPATYSTECPRCDANESTPVSTPAAPPTSPTVTASVIPLLTAAAASDGTFDDEAINGPTSTTITSSSGSPHSGVSASTDVGVVLPAAQVCIPGASTRPWLEPVPPRPPDPWSLFPGAWYRSRSGACITVQPAIKAVFWCNDTEEVPTYVFSDEVPQHDKVQRQPWPPPPEFCEDPLCDELKEILGNAASFGLQHCSSNGSRGTTLATLESQMLQLLDLLEGANQLKCTKRAQGLTRELLVEVGICQNIEAKQSDTTLGIFLDHHRKLGSVILGVLVTWLHFSGVQILALAFKETSFQTDPMSVQEFIGTLYCYLHFGAAQNLATLVCCAWEILRLLSGGYYCVGYFWMTWDPGLTSYRIIIFCCHERSDYCSLLWALEKEKQVSDSAAGHVQHIMLQSDRAEIYQLLPQSGEHLNLCLQPKPPWLSILSKIDREFEEGVHPHGKEIKCVQMMYYYQASKLHPVAVLEMHGSTYNLFSGGTHQARKVQSYMKSSYSDLYQEGIYFKVGHPSFPVVHHNTHGASQCGGVAFYSHFPMCTSMRMEQSKVSGEQIQWLANKLSGAYQIWLVAWTQGGWDVIRVAFSDQVLLSHDCYSDFINQTPVDSYYLDQAYYFDIVGTNLIYYHENSRSDSGKTKAVHMPWDPGKSVLQYHRKFRLGDKPSFKEGGMLGAWPRHPMLGCYDKLAPMGRAQALALLLIHDRRQRTDYPEGSEHGTTAAPPLPPWLSLPIPLLAVHLVSDLYTKSL